MRDGQPAPPLAQIWSNRGARACGLQAEQFATRGGDMHRATAVTAIGHGDHARRDRRSRASARAVRAVLEVPGIAGRTEEPGFRRAGQAKLWGMSLAEDDEAGPL